MTNKDNLPTPDWGKPYREFIVAGLAAWKSPKELWMELTADDFEEKHGLPALDPSVHDYKTFRRKCRRIPKREIAEQHDAWLQRYDDIKWATDKVRIQGMSNVLDKLYDRIINEGDLRKDTIHSLRQLMEQIRKERSADADRDALAKSGTSIFLTNPGNVQFDVSLIKQSVLVLRHEYGGVENMGLLESLADDELKRLRRYIDVLLAARAEGVSLEIDAEATVIDEEEETDDEAKP